MVGGALLWSRQHSTFAIAALVSSIALAVLYLASHTAWGQALFQSLSVGRTGLDASGSRGDSIPSAERSSRASSNTELGALTVSDRTPLQQFCDYLRSGLGGDFTAGQMSAINGVFVNLRADQILQLRDARDRLHTEQVIAMAAADNPVNYLALFQQFHEWRDGVLFPNPTPLQRAVMEGDFTQLQHFCGHISEVNADWTDEDRRSFDASDDQVIYLYMKVLNLDGDELSALELFLYYGHLELLQHVNPSEETLLSIGRAARGGGSALHLAVMSGKIDLVLYVLDHCELTFDNTGSDSEQLRPLDYAAVMNHAPLIEVLLERGIIELGQEHCNSAAEYAIRFGQVEAFRQFYPSIGSALAADANSWVVAAGYGRIEILSYLSTLTITEPELRLEILQQAAQEAARSGQTAALRFLCAFDELNIIERSDLFHELLLITANGGHLASFEYISSLGAFDSNIRNRVNGQTLLMCAVSSRNLQMLRRICELPELDLYQSNNDGDTALTLATRVSIEIFEDLFTRGNFINAQNDAGESLLMCAVQGGDSSIIRYLCAIPGIDFDYRNQRGQTVIEMIENAALPPSLSGGSIAWEFHRERVLNIINEYRT